ncbi:hypothetical protein FRC00_014629 [Tulasnella sp. 408]|nr:hypothetical protein FRC00_014629 [Tulasnella sp. 408]
MEEEERMRKIGWEAVREAFEYYKEMVGFLLSFKNTEADAARQGDVQMCTALATVARGELLSTDESLTLDRISSAYVDILTRLRLHTEAAYVRKYGASKDLQASTTVRSILLFMRPAVAAANH